MRVIPQNVSQKRLKSEIVNLTVRGGYLTLYLEKVVFINVIHSAGTAHLFCPVAGFSWLCDNCVLNTVSRRSDLRSTVFLFNAWVRNRLV